MKKTIFMLSVIGLFTFCSHNTYNSLQWQSNKVTADGKIPEWENPLRFYDEKSKINYTISNDRNNLYLCMKVSDETEKIKIFRSGLEFKIDTTGEKLFPIAFIFPLANQQIMMQHKKSETQTEENHGEKPDRSAMIKKHLSQAKDIQLIGFKPPLDGVISLAINKTGISAAINIDSLGIMYYEAIIPFSTFYKNELTATDTNRVFNFQITVNAVEGGGGGHSGGGSGGMGGGGGHSGGGGGGMGGGGMGGGGHHGGGGGGYSSGENIAMSETNQIKNKLKLAYK